jgi:methylthioribose-1-phosphate isomerase
VAPVGSPAFNPAFDVTPAALVTGYVTERGIVHPPFEE